MNAAPASIPPTIPRSAAMLRRIWLLLRRRLTRGSLLLRGRRRLLALGRWLLRGCRLRRGVDRAQGRLEVVEDEAGGWVAAGGRRDDRLAGANDEDAALAGRDLELRQRALAGLDLVGRGEKPAGRL